MEIHRLLIRMIYCSWVLWYYAVDGELAGDERWSWNRSQTLIWGLIVLWIADLVEGIDYPISHLPIALYQGAHIDIYMGTHAINPLFQWHISLKCLIKISICFIPLFETFALFLNLNIFYLLQQTGPKLGTMMGVFVPCLQNILGIIYYIRFSW